MSMAIYHNLTAMQIQSLVRRNNKQTASTLKQITTGQKVTDAEDGASEYAISEKMKVQIRSLDQAEANTQNGTSLLKVAEGGAQNILDNMASLKELALRSANDIYTDKDRYIIQNEWQSRVEQIDEIAESTNFNGKRLLDGSYTNGEVRGVDAFTEPQGSWTVIPADVGDITLSNDGKYHFATGYTGTVTITATNVALSGELKNSAIQFTNSGVNVYANGLSIKNDTNTGKSMIAFSGGANLLQIGTSGLKLYSDVDAGGKAGLNIGEELDIQVPDRIDSLNVYTEGSGAGIGTDAGKAAKQLRISGMGNTDIRDVSVGCGGSGAGIGTGTHGYLNRIIVENTSLDVASQGDGAAIGCGQGNSSVDHLWIEDCKGAMDTTYGDHEVPVGQDQSETGTIGNIYTRGNQVDYITGKLPLCVSIVVSDR